MKKHLNLLLIPLLLFAITITFSVRVTSAQEIVSGTLEDPSPACHNFASDIRIGARSSEVSALQKWLISKGFTIPKIEQGTTDYGYYGPQTTEAVAKYQSMVGVRGDGQYLGPLTREKINISCGNDTTTLSPTTSVGASSSSVESPIPTKLGAYILFDQHQYMEVCDSIDGQKICSTDTHLEYRDAITGKFVFVFLQKISTGRDYFIKWLNGNTTSIGSNLYSIGSQDILWFTSKSYDFVMTQSGDVVIGADGNWKYSYPYVADKDNPVVTYFLKQYPAKGTTTTTATVPVAPGTPLAPVITTTPTVASSTSSSKANLSIVLPKGGENLKRGSSQLITWRTSQAFNFTSPTTFDVSLETSVVCVTTPCVGTLYPIATSLSNVTAYQWTVGNVTSKATVPDGSYKVRICMKSPDKPAIVCDSSDTAFKIAAGTTATPTPSPSTTVSPSSSPSTTPKPISSASPSPSASVSPAATATPSPFVTPSPSPGATASPAVSPSPSASPTATPKPSSSASPSPSPSGTPVSYEVGNDGWTASILDFVTSFWK